MSRRPFIADWPARDRELWEKGVKPAGLFESGGAGADWSDCSRRKAASGNSSWLSWLAAEGLPNPDAHPGDRVDPERVSAYIEHLRVGRAPYTVLCRIQELYDAMRVMAPDADWRWLVQVYRNLRARVRPVRDKPSRLKPIDELAALGERMMQEAETAPGWSARRRAVQFRDALMIALLAYRPVRVKNLAMMRLGRHLTKVGRYWQILFAADETKSHIPYEGIVPSTLVSRLERYVDIHRPVLMRGERADSRPDAPPSTLPSPTSSTRRPWRRAACSKSRPPRRRFSCSSGARSACCRCGSPNARSPRRRSIRR